MKTIWDVAVQSLWVNWWPDEWIMNSGLGGDVSSFRGSKGGKPHDRNGGTIFYVISLPRWPSILSPAFDPSAHADARSWQVSSKHYVLMSESTV